jgi:hypothetical protein
MVHFIFKIISNSEFSHTNCFPKIQLLIVTASMIPTGRLFLVKIFLCKCSIKVNCELQFYLKTGRWFSVLHGIVYVTQC